MRLRHRYRFIIMDEVSYKQSAHANLTFGQILGVVLLALALVFFGTATVIVFTPVREFIPGYTDPQLHRKQAQLLLKLDTMETLIARQDSFIRSLQRVSGYTPADSGAIQRATTDSARIKPSAQPDAAIQPPLAVPVAYSLARPMLWAHPVPSAIQTQAYRPGSNHYAVDYAAPLGATVVAAADGVVFLNEYTQERGYVLGVQHTGGWVSFYKHNQANLVQLGSRVMAGEAIATVGNTGSHSSGPHLHFELWLDGRPLDPARYLPTQH